MTKKQLINYITELVYATPRYDPCLSKEDCKFTAKEIVKFLIKENIYDGKTEKIKNTF